MGNVVFPQVFKRGNEIIEKTGEKGKLGVPGRRGEGHQLESPG